MLFHLIVIAATATAAILPEPRSVRAEFTTDAMSTQGRSQAVTTDARYQNIRYWNFPKQIGCTLVSKEMNGKILVNRSISSSTILRAIQNQHSDNGCLPMKGNANESIEVCNLLFKPEILKGDRAAEWKPVYIEYHVKHIPASATHASGVGIKYQSGTVYNVRW